MMDISVRVQLGIFGENYNAGTLQINEETIGNSSSWAGSYHILSMGRHFHNYMNLPEPELQKNLDFPPLDCFRQLPSKSKSQQVVGNIGECIAAILARKRLRANISEIALLTTNVMRKRPDYLMNLNGQKIGILFSEAHLNQEQLNYLNQKKWWPVESKATKSIENNDSRKKALSQLISFWAKEKDTLQDSVGCGLIVTFFYEDIDHDHRPEIWVSLILPENYVGLVDKLDDPKFDSRNNTDNETVLKETFRYFYGCTKS